MRGNCGTRLRLPPSLPDGPSFGLVGEAGFFGAAAFFATGFMGTATSSGSSFFGVTGTSSGEN